MKLTTSALLTASLAFAMIAAGPAPGPDTEKAKGDPYALGVCAVTGEKFEDEATVKVIDGREVRFCCGGCAHKFAGAPDEYAKKLDEAMVEDQLPFYPLTTCVISGEPLVEDGKDVGVNVIVNNRLVRACCRMCVKKISGDPEKYVAKVDEAVKKAQGEAYPLTTCTVSEEALGSMGDPVEMVVANRLVRLCCKGCKKGFAKDPAQQLAAIDAAWEKKGMPWKTASAGSSSSGG